MNYLEHSQEERRLMAAVNLASLSGFTGFARALFQLLLQMRKSP